MEIMSDNERLAETVRGIPARDKVIADVSSKTARPFPDE